MTVRCASGHEHRRIGGSVASVVFLLADRMSPMLRHPDEPRRSPPTQRLPRPSIRQRGAHGRGWRRSNGRSLAPNSSSRSTASSTFTPVSRNLVWVPENVGRGL